MADEISPVIGVFFFAALHETSVRSKREGESGEKVQIEPPGATLRVRKHHSGTLAASERENK